MAVVTIDSFSELKKQLGLDEHGPVAKYFTNTCYRHMDKYVPLRDTGMLRTIVTLEDNAITYEMPYAVYQYYGMREDGSRVVSHWTTPGTGPYWDELMKSAEWDNVVKEIQHYLDGR